jgi:hypothetical protein
MPLEDAYIEAKLADARADRMLAQSWVNEVLRFSAPLDPQINSESDTPRDPSAADDLFDTTLQDTVDDFGSDMSHMFTPRHERWVRLEADAQLTEGQARQIQPEIDKEAQSLFGEIERSNFYSAAGSAYRNLAITMMGISITDPGQGKPMEVQHIDLASLLVARGPLGTFDARFREWPRMKRQHLPAVFPGILKVDDGGPGPAAGKVDRAVVSVIDGWVRDWTDPTIERWAYVVMVNKKVKHKSYHEGPGSCGFIVCPWRKSTRTAWMPGPAHKALPPARTLDVLNYNYLKALSFDVDPVISYEEDGIMNIEGGLDPGTWLARAAGSEAPQAIRSEARMDASVFERDRLTMQIKRALYQDRPEQAGRTPPTATQWADERAWNTRRMELPRDLVTSEWVLPIIDRFAYLRAERGQSLGITLEKTLVSLRPVTPLSKARDIEDISVTMQMLSVAGQLAQAEQMGTPIDSRMTMESILTTAKDVHIKLKSQQQVEREQQARLMQAAGIDPTQMMGAAGGAA